MRATGLVRLMVVGASAALVATSMADEDGRKLRDRQAPFVGPIWSLGDVGIAEEFPSRDVTLLSWIPLNNFPGANGGGNDCWGYVSSTGREYALMGLEKGFGVVEVTNPLKPVIIGFIQGPTSLWHDCKVIGDYAYAVSEGGRGIQVIDLRDVDNGNVSLVREVRYGGHSSTHNIVANPVSKHIYLAGANIGNGGLVAFSVGATPDNPQFVGAWTDMYVHDAQVVSYTEGPYAGREIAFVAGGYSGGWGTTGLRVVDVTDKSNMRTIGEAFWPGAGYSHQCWLSEDRQTLYLDDELDERDGHVPTTTMHIFDVSDLNNPRQVSTATNGSRAVDHNLYVRGDRLYCANYRSGLRVFDISDRRAPVEIAYFDTYPANDNPSFNGAWSNYPFLPSGIVLISDMERGLFIVRVAPGRLVVSLEGEAPRDLDPGRPTPIVATVTEEEAELDRGSVRLLISVDGGAAQEIALSDLGSNRFGGNIPAGDCFQSVDYYVEAMTTDGRPYRAPRGAPDDVYRAVVRTGFTSPFADNFNSDRGWTVANQNVTEGAWIRAVPNRGGTRGDPPSDYDGSGMCFVTGSGANEDLDGGPTRLTSPRLDLSGVGTGTRVTLRFARWMYNDDGDDLLVTELSPDDGQTWVQVDSVNNTGGWQPVSIVVRDYVQPTDRVRVRFSVADQPNNSVTEAAIDAFEVRVEECEERCYADCDGNSVLDIRDFFCFQSKFAGQEAYADCDGNSVLDIRDFFCFQGRYAQGCQ